MSASILNIRYNPLNNDLDAYAQAFNIASIITSIWGKGKEPFWQQSYTDLVRYVIVLHRVQSSYVTLVDVFRTSDFLRAVSKNCWRKQVAGVQQRPAIIAISKEDYVIAASF